MGSYHVLFSGEVVQGAEPQVVQAQLARELGITEQKADQLFSGRTVVLRSQLSEDGAEALVARLAELGAVCRTKNLDPKPANPARFKLDERRVDATLKDLTAAHVECPRCGHMQLMADHCARCGVDINQAMKQQRKEDAIIAKKIRALRDVRDESDVPNTQPNVDEVTTNESALSKVGRWFRKR